MLKSVERVRWAIAAKDESNERKMTERLRVVVVAYLVRGYFLPIYKVT